MKDITKEILGLVSAIGSVGFVIFLMAYLLGESTKYVNPFCEKYPDQILYYCGNTEVRCYERFSTSCNSFAIKELISNDQIMRNMTGS